MKKFIPTITALSMPFLTFAQIVPGGQDAEGVLSIFKRLLDVAIPIIVTLGVAYFFWGVVGYVTAKDEEKKKEARSTMISGIIGLFVIVSLWGIIALLGNTLNVGQGGNFTQIPSL